MTRTINILHESPGSFEAAGFSDDERNDTRIRRGNCSFWLRLCHFVCICAHKMCFGLWLRPQALASALSSDKPFFVVCDIIFWSTSCEIFKVKSHPRDDL